MIDVGNNGEVPHAPLFVVLVNCHYIHQWFFTCLYSFLVGGFGELACRFFNPRRFQDFFRFFQNLFPISDSTP